MDGELEKLLKIVWNDRSFIKKLSKYDTSGAKYKTKSIPDYKNEGVQYIAAMRGYKQSQRKANNLDIAYFAKSVFDIADRYRWSIDFQRPEDGASEDECVENCEWAHFKQFTGLEVLGKFLHLRKFRASMQSNYLIFINAKEARRADILGELCDEISDLQAFQVPRISVALPGYERPDTIVVHCDSQGTRDNLLRCMELWRGSMTAGAFGTTAPALSYRHPRLSGVGLGIAPPPHVFTANVFNDQAIRREVQQNNSDRKAGLSPSPVAQDNGSREDGEHATTHLRTGEPISISQHKRFAMQWVNPKKAFSKAEAKAVRASLPNMPIVAVPVSRQSFYTYRAALILRALLDTSWPWLGDTTGYYFKKFKKKVEKYFELANLDSDQPDIYTSKHSPQIVRRTNNTSAFGEIRQRP